MAHTCKPQAESKRASALSIEGSTTTTRQIVPAMEGKSADGLKSISLIRRKKQLAHRSFTKSAQAQGANKIEQSLVITWRGKVFAGEPSVQSGGAQAEVPGSALNISSFGFAKSN